jgi:hypothetical protein
MKTDDKKLSPLVREISWTNNIIKMMAVKSNEELKANGK